MSKISVNRSLSRIDETSKIKRSKSLDKAINILDCTKKTIKTKKNKSKLYATFDNFSSNRTTENSVEFFK